MSFELISEGFNRHSEDIRTCGKLESNKSGLALARLGGKERWAGELSLACPSAVPTWGLRVPLARRVFVLGIWL